MSGIGAAGFGSGVNPYAGNLNSTKGSDAARADSSDRSTAAQRSEFSQNLSGAGEAGRSDDRDADAFFSGSGDDDDQNHKSEEQSETADGSNLPTTPGAEVAGQPLDDHRGNMINFDV